MDKKLDNFRFSMLRGLVEDLIQDKILRPYPIEEIQDVAEKKDVHVFVKREHDNAKGVDPVRSIKRKPARLMAIVTEEMKPNRDVWISASSGNFAEELGLVANELDKKFFAVIPPRTPSRKVETLRSLGVNVVKVTREEYDLCPREFTVFWVRAITSRHHRLVNIDQYNSILNPLSHLLMTAKEIEEEFDGELTYIFVPLGSTGTFAGIYEYFARFYPKTKIVGVQPTKEHNIPGVHYVTNGCKWSPEIFGLPDKRMVKVLTIDDRAAYEALIELEVKYGIHGGPSTGMVFAAVKQELKNIEEGNVLFTSADSAWDYREWNREILTKLKVGEDAIFNEYLKNLEKREKEQKRINRVKRIYGPSEKGEIYSLEDFEDLLSELL